MSTLSRSQCEVAEHSQCAHLVACLLYLHADPLPESLTASRLLRSAENVLPFEEKVLQDPSCVEGRKMSQSFFIQNQCFLWLGCC